MNNERIPIVYEVIESGFVLIDWKFINDFAKLTTDFNPIHTNLEYITKKTIYNNPIAHGQIGVSLICALLGNTFKGIMLKNQSLNFLKPVMINSYVKSSITCLSIKEVSNIYKNIEVSFLVKLTNDKSLELIAGKVLMFMWGKKR
jgi:acyl dehydratase